MPSAIFVPDGVTRNWKIAAAALALVVGQRVERRVEMRGDDVRRRRRAVRASRAAAHAIRPPSLPATAAS